MELEQPDFDGVPLDEAMVPQALLDILDKRRSNLFPWNGQFSPQLIEILLGQYAPRSGLVLDPFAGGGTVLFEASRLGLASVGTEINPAACAMARIAELANLTLGKRRLLTSQLESTLQEKLPDEEPSLFHGGGPVASGEVRDAAVMIHEGLDDQKMRWMLEAIMVLADLSQDTTSAEVFTSWAKLKTTILNLPESDAPTRLLNLDARRLSLRAGEIDFVITSPPYINVFNYHQKYRRAMEALGWNLLAVSRSEIGANRKHRQNRFLTVVQYCLDMTESLREISRVCKAGTRVIMVVGRESRVRKTRFFNGEIMSALATRCLGFSFVLRQERVFRNRFGEEIREDLLHFLVGSCGTEEPSAVGREALMKARARAPDESLSDLDEALSAVEQVRPSPIFDESAARPCPRRGVENVVGRCR